METDEPIRRCIVSGERAGRAGLIRLALGPDGVVLPDVAAKAPGRGAWLTPDRSLIEGRAAGKLRGALARAFKSNEVRAPDDLALRIEAALRRRAFDLLGLANKAGHLIWGHERIGDALGHGRVHLLLHAADGSPDQRSKLDTKARACEVPALTLPADRAELSVALGRENIVCAALRDSGAAARVGEAVRRWRAFNGLDEERAEAGTPAFATDEVVKF